MYRAIQEHPDLGFVQAGFTYFRNGKIAEVAQSYPDYYGRDMNYLCSIFRGRAFSHIIRRNLLRDLRFDERIANSQDLIFTIDYLSRIERYALLSEVGYYYRCDNAFSVMHTHRTIKYDEMYYFFIRHFENTVKFIETHQIKRSAAKLRYTQMADSLVFAICTLYREFSADKRLIHLRNDFTDKHFMYLKYCSGKRNKLIFALLRLKLYPVFDHIMAKRIIQ